MRPLEVGLQYCDSNQAFEGYTLFCGRAHAWLMDLEGRFVHRWSHPQGIQYATLLSNGNLLCRALPSEGVRGQRGLNGQTPVVYELDWQSQVVWQFEDDWLHHDHERLPNGNTLLLAWRPMSRELSAQVKGGFVSDNDEPEMLGDVIFEVTPDGQVAREWRAWEHLDLERDTICPIDHRKEWTHANSIATTNDGQWLVSFRRIDTVATIDPVSGAITNRIGPGVLSHQHDARMLDTGNITVFDNGVHRKGGAEFSQAAELDPATGEIVWRYQSSPPFRLFSFMAGSTERLPGGNTLICQSQVGRFFEVNADGATVWSYTNPFFADNPRLGGRMNIVFKVHRYAADHPGLQGRDLTGAHHDHLVAGHLGDP